MSFPADDSIWDSFNFSEDNYVSHAGQAPGIDPTSNIPHLPGCPYYLTLPFHECFWCSTASFREPSLSPQLHYDSTTTSFQEPSQNLSRTYAQVAAQAAGTQYGIPQTVVTQANTLRPPPAQQAQSRPTQQQHYGYSTPSQTLSAVQTRRQHQRTYAQAAQRQEARYARQAFASSSGHASSIRPPPMNYTSTPQRGVRPSHDQSVSAEQWPREHVSQMQLQTPYSSTQRSRPQNSTQVMLPTSMDNLDSILRPEYTDNPRNVESMVEGTMRGSHRFPVTQTFNNQASPITPTSPGTMSMRSGSSQQSRRTGPALRDPRLAHRCEVCRNTFAKGEDLRRHIQRTHSAVAERPHRCLYPGCDWAFVNPKDLRRHARTHPQQSSAPQSRFNCCYSDCDRSYTRMDNLQRHMNKDHEVDSGIGYSPSMSRTTSQSSYHAQPFRHS